MPPQPQPALPPNGYPAAQLALALRVNKRSVLKALADSPATGTAIVRGNATPIWTLAGLPARLHAELLVEAAKTQETVAQYVDGLVKLAAHGVAPWQPPLALAEIADDCLADATKLRAALLPALQRHESNLLSTAERERLGLADYQKAFGYTITARHWRGLIARTLQRAGSAREFHKLELYLPKKPKPKSNAARLLPHESAFKGLRKTIESFKNPAAPTAAEKSALWSQTFELTACASSKSERKVVRRELVRFLSRHAPALAENAHALHVNFERKFKTWNQKGRLACALEDKRLAKAAGKPPIDPDQIGLIKFTAARRHDGMRAPALRELVELGLITDPRIKASLENSTRKSYLLPALRQQLKSVPAMRICFIGDRAANKMTPAMSLTFEGLHSMDMLCGDDKTVDIYVPVPDGKGWYEMIRPQMLLFVDVKSMFIVSRVIIPRPQYSALTVWGGYKQAFLKWGLTKWIQREGGIWRKAKLVNTLAAVGRREMAHSQPEIEFGLSRKGTRFFGEVDAPSTEMMGAVGIDFREVRAARGKIVERVIGVFSDLCSSLPGYCGRDERVDCPEATKKAIALVRARKARPEEVGFMMWTEFVSTMDATISKYNSTKQEGRRLTHPDLGYLSPEEAFGLYWNHADPPVKFDADCEILLSHPPVEAVVKSPNLRRKNFPCGFVEVRGNTYCDKQTAARIGEKLLAYHDPTLPETCTFTDMDGKNPFTVARLESVNGWFADEQTQVSLAQARSVTAALKEEYRAMDAKFSAVFRRNMVSASTRDLSQQIKEQSQTVKDEQKHQDRLRQRASALGVSLSPRIKRREQVDDGLEWEAQIRKELEQETKP